MRVINPLRLLPLLAPLLVLACQVPPPEAYTKTTQTSVTKPVAEVSIGKNSVGEACTQQAASGQSADVFCGTWEQPSARVRSGGPGSAADLPQLATASPWRSNIDHRFRCEQPVATTIL